MKMTRHEGQLSHDKPYLNNFDPNSSFFQWKGSASHDKLRFDYPTTFTAYSGQEDFDEFPPYITHDERTNKETIEP